MTTQIIDNCLPIKFFKEIQSKVITNAFLWQFNMTLNNAQSAENTDSYFSHVVYFNDMPNSGFYNDICPILKYLPDFHSLIRIKVNLYPRQDVLTEHTPHLDNPYPHKGAILYLNTCDGFTRLPDRTVDSIENRLLVFDASVKHNSTNTTTPPGRFNININYL